MQDWAADLQLIIDAAREAGALAQQLRRDGLDVFGNPMSRLAFERPHDSLQVNARLLVEVFLVWAESSMSIWTVRMSPTRLARWSMKKARAPVRHSELADAA